MKLRLLDLLVCHDCTGKIVVERGLGGAEEITDGHLKCTSCERLFGVRRGAPDFSPQELDFAEARNVKCFGYEWTTFNYFEPDGEKRAFFRLD